MGKSAYQEALTEAMKGRLIIVAGVAAVIRNEQGWVLIERRSDNGDWDLPAGAVDPGETPRQAIVREVEEETGLVVSVTGIAGVFGGERFRHTYEDGQEVEGFTVIFDCEVTGGALRSVDGEAETFRYVSPEEVPPLMMPYPRALFQAGRRGPVIE
jgi:8-oxo-dGTP pyrophosphatase MutT (NUDIX family)